ncbi:hypothetical protein C8Q74DRAFT_1310930 [Fomes fomentarius]|nr:hypothetical protein C8Q74DRAFT_1310930 [Fomes fomentarius]
MLVPLLGSLAMPCHCDSPMYSRSHSPANQTPSTVFPLSRFPLNLKYTNPAALLFGRTEQSPAHLCSATEYPYVTAAGFGPFSPRFVPHSRPRTTDCAEAGASSVTRRLGETLAASRDQLYRGGPVNCGPCFPSPSPSPFALSSTLPEDVFTLQSFVPQSL